MKGIYFNGRRVLRPQAVSKIDDSGMYGRGLGGGNTVALIGESTGGEPGKIQWFTDPATAKAILRSGNLLTAIQRAYDPSSYAGAYLIGAIRVNHFTTGGIACAQATAYLLDANGNSAILLTSVDYGVWNNQIKYKVETGTDLIGKKITLTYGSSYEQGDNIPGESFAIGLADPSAASGTVTIVSGSAGTLETAVTATVLASTPQPSMQYFNTGASFSMVLNGTSDAVYVGSTLPFNAITYTISGANAVVANFTGNVKYWNGSAWTSVGVITDGTMVATATLAQTGAISFTLPTAWQHSAVASEGGYTAPALDRYWLKLQSSAGLTGGTAASAAVLTRQGLNITLSNYPTIQELVDYIDVQLGYEAVALTTAPTVDLSTEIDPVTAQNLLVTVTTFTSIATATITTGGDPIALGFVAGDKIIISQKAPTSYPSEELATIESVSTTTIVLTAAPSLTYASGDPIRKCYEATANMQAAVDWINDNSSYVTAVRQTGITGALANIPDTYLTGGSDGITLQADWDAALELFQTEDVQLMSCISYDPAVWASLSAHVSYMSTVGKKERRGFCGGFATADGYTSGKGKWTTTALVTASVNKMLVYATEVNSDRMYYVGPGIIAYDENGTKTTYPGSIAAAMAAGLAGGVDVAEPLTHKNIKCNGLEYNLGWADLDRLLDGGVFPLEYDPSFGYRVCQSISTWLTNDNYYRRELSVGRVGDYVARQLRDRLEQDFVGKKGTNTTLISIKNATLSVLDQMYKLDLLAGNADNPPYKNVQVNLVADTVYVEFECSPVIPINYIPITIHLTVFTATLTA